MIFKMPPSGWHFFFIANQIFNRQTIFNLVPKTSYSKSKSPLPLRMSSGLSPDKSTIVDGTLSP